ncbi:MAG: hypothetical protein IT204_20130 [Fimbriimonadaceae bacterium]|nr:hypothetical protein [Fimbriimonadaceae bacterium]
MVERRYHADLEIAWGQLPGRRRRGRRGALRWLPSATGGYLLLALAKGPEELAAAGARLIVSTPPGADLPSWLRERHAALQAGFGDSLTASAIALRLDGGQLDHAWVGDLRLYHYLAGERCYRTADQSVVEALVQSGRLPEDEMRRHLLRHTLTATLGGSDRHELVVAPPDTALARREIVAGSTLLVTSAGLHHSLGEAVLAAHVAAPGASSTVAAALLAAAATTGVDEEAWIAVLRPSTPRPARGRPASAALARGRAAWRTRGR